MQQSWNKKRTKTIGTSDINNNFQTWSRPLCVTLSIMTKKGDPPPPSRRPPEEGKAEGGPSPRIWYEHFRHAGNPGQWLRDNPLFPIPPPAEWLNQAQNVPIDGMETEVALLHMEEEEEEETLRSTSTEEMSEPTVSATAQVPPQHEWSVPADARHESNEEDRNVRAPSLTWAEQVQAVRQPRDITLEEGKSPGGLSPRLQLARRARQSTEEQERQCGLPPTGPSIGSIERRASMLDRVDRRHQAERVRRQEEEELEAYLDSRGIFLIHPSNSSSRTSSSNGETSELSEEDNCSEDEDSNNDWQCNKEKK